MVNITARRQADAALRESFALYYFRACGCEASRALRRDWRQRAAFYRAGLARLQRRQRAAGLPNDGVHDQRARFLVAPQKTAMACELVQRPSSVVVILDQRRA